MTWNNEIVDEVRKVRDKHSSKFNCDISLICADVRQKQIESGRQVVTSRKREIVNVEAKPEVLEIA